jgi:hypothetical protein
VGVKYRLTVLVCDLLLCQQRMEPPPENGLEDGQDDEPPRALRLISSFEKKTLQQSQDVKSWKTHVRKKSTDDIVDEEVPPAKPSPPTK